MKMTLQRAVTAGVLTLSLIGSGGCSLMKTDAHVFSDTAWSGSFDGRTVDGTGDQTIALGGGTGSKCASVQKQTREGYLRVKIDGGEELSTAAAYGVVTVCGGSGL